MATDVLNGPEVQREQAYVVDDDGAARPRRRFNPWLIAAVIGALVLAWGVKRYIYGRNHESTDNAQVDGHITPIAPKLSAFVARVLVDDNAHVKAGDTLVVLDDRDVRVRLEQAEADLATARAAAGTRGVGQAEAQLSSTRASAASAQANVAAAEAAARKADADLARYQGLAEKQIISAQQLDAARAAAEAAHANLDAARRQASAGGSNVTAAAANVRAADAKLAAAQTAVDNARLQLSYTVITAPASGVVARRSVEPGELVQVGQQLMAVVPDSGVWVTANLKETQLEHVSPGDSAEFSVDAYPGVTFHGAVQSLSPATGARFALLPPDNATGNFTKVVQRVPVRIAVDNPSAAEHPLRPGMSVEVTITTH
ncbi:MAG TPA: HlyD family secretion protein [Gemmatimonadales bacterium]|nr:HlyD family secretion protein [Gemmatimonadales bacterium]